MEKPDEQREGDNPALCPWCNAPVESAEDLEEGRYDCESCHKAFDLTAEKTIFYTTVRVEEETKEGGD